MNIFKSHFWYNKSQRNGIFILAILILLLQVYIVFGYNSSIQKIDANSSQTLSFHKQIDSLKTVEIDNRKPKVYPFNPNYITDSKGEQLGLSLEEIDKLLSYRKEGNFVNSKEEFQEITNVSDSLLNIISPYFKFPDWVNKRNSKLNVKISSATNVYYAKPEYKLSTTDLNKATALDLKSISGIGEKLSERIIKYRSKLQGFSIDKQVHEVWGLKPQIADKVIAVFKVNELPNIQKTNVNTASFKELLKNPYVDYELCKLIFEYRDEVAELQNISELKNINGFPLELYDRIVLYLVAK